MKRVFFYLFVFLTSIGCYYDVEEELYPTLECQTDEVTYSGTVRPILVDNCYKCHDKATNFANITLEGYDNFIKYVNSGQVLGAIRRLPGFTPMPRNEPPLLECDIEKIEAWINAGAPNN
ncbi:MAG: hypothetical protein D6714_02845 [Bacteroidetes bacterium]|nr:MAG: hypothetical protein D6714_02845 [Bacteroidota bacterium]